MISVKVLYRNEIKQLIFFDLLTVKKLFETFNYTIVDEVYKLKKQTHSYIEKTNSLNCDTFLKHTINWLSKVNNSNNYYFNVVNFIYDTLNVSDEIYEKLLFSGESLSNNEIDQLNNLADFYYEKNYNNIYSINFENINVSNYINIVFHTIQYVHLLFLSDGLRMGQSFFNALNYVLPIVANKIRSDNLLDCYYNDKNLNNLICYLNKHKRFYITS